MKVQIKYFGSIAEERGSDAEERTLNDGADLQTLVEWVAHQSATVQNKNFRIAVNQIISEQGELRDGDEIAFLPPYAGG